MSKDIYHDDGIENNYTEDVVFDPETETNELEEKLRKHQMDLTKYISMSDITECGIVWKDLTQKQRLELLWNAGLNVRGYVYVSHRDEHVNIKGKRVTCVRFICQERTDKEWIDTGLASDMAYFKYKQDPSLMYEIKRLEDCYLDSVQ